MALPIAPVLGAFWLKKALGMATEERKPYVGQEEISWLERDPATKAAFAKQSGLTQSYENVMSGRAGLGADLQSAAEQEMEAVRTNVGMQLAQALRRSDVTMAQRGMLRSGEAIQGRQTLEQAAMRDVATASAGIQLEKMGLQQQGLQARRTYDLQVAQLEAGRKMAESAMYQQMATLGIQLALQNPDFLSSLFGGGGEEELYTNPGMTSILEAYQ